MKEIDNKMKCEETSLLKVVIPATLGDDTGAFAPVNGAYKNKIVEYEANGVVYIYSDEGIFTKIGNRSEDVILYSGPGNKNDGAMTQRATTKYVDDETAAREQAVSDLQTTLGDQINSLSYGKQNALTAGDNITIENDVISAVDSTYSTMVGATGSENGQGGLVPAPQAGDNVKFLSGDGIWKTVSSSALPTASASELGGVKIGSNLTIDPVTGVLSADAQQVTLYDSTGQNTDGAMTQKAASDALGLKADASSLATVATTGAYSDLTGTPSPYSLPTAAANTLGGIKVGSNLSISNGVLSANTPIITLQTTDPGEGATLAANNFIAVYGA